MLKRLLSSLLHRANRETKSEHFYTIKKKLLKKYGTHDGYDVQFIEGKKCFTCGGTGIYTGYDWNGYQFSDTCNRCWGGWYKQPVWNILERVKFGKYVFHQPFERAYKKPDITKPVIDGYIEHTRAKYGALSLVILFLIYEKGYISRWWKEPTWWRCYWWLPRNWFYCLVHILKNGTKSYPATEFKNWWNKESGYVPGVVYDYNFFVGRTAPQEQLIDDLSFLTLFHMEHQNIV